EPGRRHRLLDVLDRVLAGRNLGLELFDSRPPRLLSLLRLAGLGVGFLFIGVIDLGLRARLKTSRYRERDGFSRAFRAFLRLRARLKTSRSAGGSLGMLFVPQKLFVRSGVDERGP